VTGGTTGRVEGSGISSSSLPQEEKPAQRAIEAVQAKNRFLRKVSFIGRLVVLFLVGDDH